ncbi:unnamed protein product [Clonostachys rhizophaga]|uniref:Uncharacterized protein n=1 Tax=Clonostachys rhizophaga TaxID=160324 RepID=A0A9N9VGL5_9HYPO|nr:unnamed protein product [Clonostachys rhizophaga]
MRDLASVTQEKGSNIEELQEKVQKTLNSLPNELDEYYGTIIERIPSGFRREAYMALEVICRAEEEISLNDMVHIIDCSRARNLEEARARTKETSRITQGYVQKYGGKGYIRMLSGGLIDIVHHDGKSQVQFMHQTIKDFVEDPRFKALILEKWRANFAKENGHSFLAKYHFLATDFGKSCIYHAQEAEVTTGLSQFKDYAQSPFVPYTFIMNGFSRKLLSPLAFSVFSGLKLCIEDAYKADPSCLANCSDDLIVLLHEAVGRTYHLRNAIDLARSLVAKGMRGQRSLVGMRQVSGTIWSLEPSMTAEAFTGEPNGVTTANSDDSH